MSILLRLYVLGLLLNLPPAIKLARELHAAGWSPLRVSLATAGALAIGVGVYVWTERARSRSAR